MYLLSLLQNMGSFQVAESTAGPSGETWYGL